MKKNRRNTFLGRVALGVLFLSFAVFLIVSFYFSSNTPVRNEIANKLDSDELFGDERGQNVNLESVVNDPDSFYGSVISVSGSVRQNLDTRGIVLKSPQLNDERLLVVSREMLIGVVGGPGDYVYKPDDYVRVSGVVRELNLDQLEQEIGVEINKNRFTEFEGKPVVIADSIIQLQTL